MVLKAAIVFAVIIALAVMFFYLRAPNSTHHASTAGQRVSEAKQSSEVDEVTGLLTDRHRWPYMSKRLPKVILLHSAAWGWHSL